MVNVPQPISFDNRNYSGTISTLISGSMTPGSYKVDFGLFKKLAPDHQPQVDLTSSIKDLKMGLDTIGFDDGDFRNSSLMRLKVLTHLIDRGLLNANLQWTHFEI